MSALPRFNASAQRIAVVLQWFAAVLLQLYRTYAISELRLLLFLED